MNARGVVVVALVWVGVLVVLSRGWVLQLRRDVRRLAGRPEEVDAGTT